MPQLKLTVAAAQPKTTTTQIEIIYVLCRLFSVAYGIGKLSAVSWLNSEGVLSA